MTNGIDVATSLVNTGCREKTFLSQLPLQKLVVLSQSLYTYRYDSPLFDEHILAWKWGPVVRSVWDRFNRYGKTPIMQPIPSERMLTDGEADTLDEVMSVFCPLGNKVVDLTHLVGPWTKYKDKNATIPLDELAEAWPEYKQKAFDMLSEGHDETPGNYWVEQDKLEPFQRIMEQSLRKTRDLELV